MKEYEKDGRRYFEYANEGKMQNFFNISSARYEVAEESFRNSNGKDVKIQIFHHKDHMTGTLTESWPRPKISLEYLLPALQSLPVRSACGFLNSHVMRVLSPSLSRIRYPYAEDFRLGTEMTSSDRQRQ